MKLAPESLRVLGSLMEKEMTTPDLYPLSLNALLAAANQRSSRDPVMELTEDEVRTAVHALEAEGMVAPARDASRVARYEHRIRTVLNLRRDETAILCLLLLRGPQTPGELRSRADRLHTFDDLAAVQSTLERLASREESLTVALPRAAGAREIRWAHLLGQAATQSVPVPPREDPSTLDSLRTLIEDLELRVKRLETRAEAEQEHGR